MAFRAPLLGYNTNVRHKGKLYHIQTEDSGVGHPHVMTHLFADGGRIVASRKTSYAQHVGADDLQDIVKKLMQGQHKAMFIALRDGDYDEETVVGSDPPVTPEAAPQAEPPAPPAKHEPPPLYQEPRVASGSKSSDGSLPAKPPVSIFGGDLMSEKSLDEVILSYLASDDAGDPKR